MMPAAISEADATALIIRAAEINDIDAAPVSAGAWLLRMMVTGKPLEWPCRDIDAAVDCLARLAAIVHKIDQHKVAIRALRLALVADADAHWRGRGEKL